MVNDISELKEKYGDNLNTCKKNMSMEDLMYYTVYSTNKIRRVINEKKTEIKESSKGSS